jgi:flagellar basal-body rod modification protein FlgD
MSISALSALSGSGTTSTSSSSSADSTTLGKDAFLKLLITQLQHQDPLNPADSTEFTAQLAQFSSLEQLSNVNENLASLKQYEASINNAQAVSFIGKDIVSKGNTIQMTSGQPVACEFELDNAAKRVVVSIYDSTGGFVKDVVATGLNAGRQTVTWDGKDRNGNTAADGAFTFEVQAEGSGKEAVGATTYSRGTVSGVTFQDGITYLTLGNGKVAIGDVVQITQATGSTSGL